jgi:hypothetical protein
LHKTKSQGNDDVDDGVEFGVILKSDDKFRASRMSKHQWNSIPSCFVILMILVLCCESSRLALSRTT